MRSKSELAFAVLIIILLLGSVQTVVQDLSPHGSVNQSEGASTPFSEAASTTTASGSYIKTYGNIVSNTAQLKDTFPEDIQGTSDGGYVFLASTDCTTYACATAEGGTHNLVNWLVKTDSFGNQQWQREVGCFNTPPGDYSIGVSLQQTSDGGYILGGGTIGCGSGNSCPFLSGIRCALVERLDAAGDIVWARTYAEGVANSGLFQIKQTADGGYVGVGVANTLPSQDMGDGGLILKLDAAGNVQWQQLVGPSGSDQAYFNAVQQTSDGGYVAAGYFIVPTSGLPLSAALVVKFGSSGNIQWQRAYGSFDSNGSPIGGQKAQSIVQSADGGYAFVSFWSNATNGFGGGCCTGSVLFKLDPNGVIQWQRGYEGGVYCFFNGYSETCANLSPFVYSILQSVDGGYVLAGDSDLILTDNVPLEPWLAKVDSNGNLLWQYLYYQTYAPSGRPLGENFVSVVLAQDGGFQALGSTEDYLAGLNLLYVVKTDSEGLVAGCSEVHPASPLSAFNPGLTEISSSLPISTALTVGAPSPSNTRTTWISIEEDCSGGSPPPPGDFGIGASPNSLSIARGGTGSSTVAVISLNGFNGPISLAVGSQPQGVRVQFNPGSVSLVPGGTGTSTVTLSASSRATLGTFSITVIGTSGKLIHNTTINVDVTPSIK